MVLFSPPYFAPALHYANLFLCPSFCVFHLCNSTAHSVSIPPTSVSFNPFPQSFLVPYSLLSSVSLSLQHKSLLIHPSAPINIDAALIKQRSTFMLLQCEVEEKERGKQSRSALLLGVQTRPRLGHSCNCKNELKMEHANAGYTFWKLSNAQDVSSGSI